MTRLLTHILSFSETVLNYIASLQPAGSDEDDPVQHEHEAAMKEEAFPPTHNDTDLTSDDPDKSMAKKQDAAEAKEAGDLAKALECYTEAILSSPNNPSALLYSNRAAALLTLSRPLAAERDCNLALAINPDSARALRVRGKVYKELHKWELALKDLSAAQSIDFDEGTVADLKLCSDKHLEHERAVAEERNQKEEALRKKARDIKEAQERNRREAEDEDDDDMDDMPRGGMGGMPGGGQSPFGAGGMPGMPGGMPGGVGMPNMADIMGDPELMNAMQNPKVMAAFSSMMSGGMPDMSKLQGLMADPEVGPVLSKLMSKFGGGMGGMGGQSPFGGGGGMPGAGAADDDDDDMDIPDLEEYEG